MKFLEYTKKLYEKVAYYDNVAKHSNMSNPFLKPKKVTTVIWIEDKKN